jgi:hypothetical protein
VGKTFCYGAATAAAAAPWPFETYRIKKKEVSLL